MTRYLPIRKEDFDLKTHIESSGHGVDTCLHVVLSSKVHVRGPGHGGPWLEAPPWPWNSGLSARPNASGLCLGTWSAGLERCWGQLPTITGTSGGPGLLLRGGGFRAELLGPLSLPLPTRSAVATWSRWAARLSRGGSAGSSSIGSSAPFPITWVSSRPSGPGGPCAAPWTLPPGTVASWAAAELPSGAGLGWKMRVPGSSPCVRVRVCVQQLLSSWEGAGTVLGAGGSPAAERPP